MQGGVLQQHPAGRAGGERERERDVGGDAGLAERGVEVAVRKDVARRQTVGEERVRKRVAREREEERSDDPIHLGQVEEPFVDAVLADREPRVDRRHVRGGGRGELARQLRHVSLSSSMFEERVPGVALVRLPAEGVEVHEHYALVASGERSQLE